MYATRNWQLDSVPNPSMWPHKLHTLVLTGSWHSHLIDFLPRSLTYLDLSCAYSGSRFPLPPNLETLIIQENFEGISRLESLTSLEIGDRFFQILDLSVLPSSLRTLHLRRCYQELPINVLPTSLTSFTLGDNFNQKLHVGVLPCSLTYLSLGPCFNQELRAGVLPNSLLYLHLGEKFNQIFGRGILPASLLSLHFHFQSLFDQPITPSALPTNLQILEFGARFNSSFGLPESLTHLIFGRYFNQVLSVGTLPFSLTRLEFGKHFNQPLWDQVLPPSLTCLKFTKNSLFNLVLIMPSSLRIAKFGKRLATSNVYYDFPAGCRNLQLYTNTPRHILRIPTKTSVEWYASSDEIVDLYEDFSSSSSDNEGDDEDEGDYYNDDAFDEEGDEDDE